MPKIRFKTFPNYIMMTLFNEKIIARCMVGATLLSMPMSHNEMKASAVTLSTTWRTPMVP